MDYAALRSELTGDPLGRGYAAMSNAEAAARINTVDRTLPRGDVARADVLARIDEGELAALYSNTTNAGAAKQRALAFALDQPVIDPANAIVQRVILEVFSAGSSTLKNLTGAADGAFPGDDLRVRAVSRAVELGIATRAIEAVDVAQVRT